MLPEGKVSVLADDMTLGDMEALEEAAESGSVRQMLRVFDRVLRIEGVAEEDVPAVIRSWKLPDLMAVGDSIRAEIAEHTNPERAGKN